MVKKYVEPPGSRDELPLLGIGDVIRRRGAWSDVHGDGLTSTLLYDHR